MNRQRCRIELRPVVPGDLDLFFRNQQDPEANDMAKVYPRPRADFDAHWKRVLADPSVIARTILLDKAVVGKVSAFPAEGTLCVGYWIDRAHWGKGIATTALRMLLQTVPTRPVYARVAASNTGSIRVLEHCGFVKVRVYESPENERYAACVEAEYRLG